MAVCHAGKAVRQLGSLLFEMEVLRSFLETEAELRYFDTRVNPAKVLAHRVVNNLKGISPLQQGGILICHDVMRYDDLMTNIHTNSMET